MLRPHIAITGQVRLFGDRGASSFGILDRLLVLLVLSPVLGCTAGPRLWDPGATDPTIHDLGIVEAGSTHSHVYRLKNTSGTRVDFERFQTTCNCSRVAIDKESLEPRETFEITVTFQAAPRANDSAVTVIAYFRGEEPWIVPLRLLAKVRPAVALSTPELRWQSNGSDDLVERVFLVRNYSSTKWTAVALTSSEPWLGLKAERAASDQGALETWRCTARPTASGLAAGEYSALIGIAPAGADTEATLPVTVSIREPAILMPDHLFCVSDLEGEIRTVDLAFVFRTDRIPTSPDEFFISSNLGDSVRPRIVRKTDGTWILRCDFSASRDAIRDQFRVDIPSAGASLTVPVYVAASKHKVGT